MSMTIRRAFRAVSTVALVLGIWALIMIVMPFIGPSGRQIAVVGDGARAARVIAAAGGRIVETRKGATLALSDRPDFANALYRHGATLVLEGRIAAGCFSRS